MGELGEAGEVAGGGGSVAGVAEGGVGGEQGFGVGVAQGVQGVAERGGCPGVAGVGDRRRGVGVGVAGAAGPAQRTEVIERPEVIERLPWSLSWSLSWRFWAC